MFKMTKGQNLVGLDFSTIFRDCTTRDSVVTTIVHRVGVNAMITAALTICAASFIGI